MAGRRGLINEQAICNELFADYMVKHGDLDEARYDMALRLNSFESGAQRLRYDWWKINASDSSNPSEKTIPVGIHYAVLT